MQFQTEIDLFTLSKLCKKVLPPRNLLNQQKIIGYACILSLQKDAKNSEVRWFSMQRMTSIAFEVIFKQLAFAKPKLLKQAVL